MRNKHNNKKEEQTTASILNTVWRTVCRPFKFIWSLCKKLWKFICNIELIGLINTTLLVAIIVMFSMLIIDIINNSKTRVIVLPARPTVQQNSSASKTPTLPLQKNEKGNYASGTIQVVPATGKPTFQLALNNNVMYGDIIIENRNDAELLHTNMNIKGNLYLQNMRKYVLPCGTKIDGNLFLRDLGMLEFCGAFTVTGNIYVSPRSSFGPIPRNARLGGQVIL